MKNEAQIRILLLQQYLCTLTDEEHAASVSDILQFWESHGIQAGRKSVYSDIQILIDQGIDIVILLVQEQEADSAAQEVQDAGSLHADGEESEQHRQDHQQHSRPIRQRQDRE